MSFWSWFSTPSAPPEEQASEIVKPILLEDIQSEEFAAPEAPDRDFFDGPIPSQMPATSFQNTLMSYRVLEMRRKAAEKAAEERQKRIDAQNGSYINWGYVSVGFSAAVRNFLDKLFVRHYYEGGFLPEMTVREASQILGLRERATREVIMKRYRELMRFNHPDVGGSPFITTKLNEAKELMYKHASHEKKRKYGF